MQKPAPVYSVDLVLHPAHDATFTHFENAAANPFQANPADFPRVNAWWLAEAALLTYWKPADAIPIFQRAGFQAEFLTAESTDCYVASQKDWAVVAFRGTEPDQWKDVLTDVDILLVPWTSGLVHLGFKKAFEEIRPQLDPIVEQLAHGRTLWFCGHSLGASLATLAADQYKRPGGVCTFGSPRVGDFVFAHAFNRTHDGKTLRYVNNQDGVTHVPLPPLYDHVDVRRFIAADGTVSAGLPAILDAVQELIRGPRHFLATIEDLRAGRLQAAPEFVLHHMPKAYAIWSWNDYDAHR